MTTGGKKTQMTFDEQLAHAQNDTYNKHVLTKEQLYAMMAGAGFGSVEAGCRPKTTEYVKDLIDDIMYAADQIAGKNGRCTITHSDIIAAVQKDARIPSGFYE